MKDVNVLTIAFLVILSLGDVTAGQACQCGQNKGALEYYPENNVYSPDDKVFDSSRDYVCLEFSLDPPDVITKTPASQQEQKKTVECKVNNEHFPAHGTACRGFYHCDHNKGVLKYCPENTVFSPDHKVCVWPRDYACPENQH